MPRSTFGEWPEHRIDVLKSIERLETHVQRLDDHVQSVRRTVDRLAAERALVGTVAAIALGALFRWMFG